MSAALQVPSIWAVGRLRGNGRDLDEYLEPNSASRVAESSENDDALPDLRLAFYRKHTEKMLRRYLYASMLVGRAPAILGEPVARGWVSSRPVKTFEDAVIFVLDVDAVWISLDRSTEHCSAALHCRSTRIPKQRICWASACARSRTSIQWLLIV